MKKALASARDLQADADLVRTAPVSEGSRRFLRMTLVFAAVVEMGTGLALMADPAVVVALLLGSDVSGVGVLLGRCFGIALLALGLACWPCRERAEVAKPAVRAMLLYNALIAAFLAWLGAAEHLGGLLLWPAAGLHACVALILAWTWRDQRPTKAANR